MSNSKLAFKTLVLFLVAEFSSLAWGAAPNSREIVDALGQKVMVPAEPLRIAALSEIDLDSLLALGLSPIATVNGRGQHSLPHYLLKGRDEKGLKGITIVGDIGRPNIEILLALKPDLILTGPNRPEVYAMLAKIAPTVQSFQNGEDWKNVFLRVAKIVNQEAQAQSFMDRYQQKLTEAKTKLKGWQGKQVSIVRWNPKGPAYMHEDAFSSLVLRDMGLVRPLEQRKPGQKHSLPLSLEALKIIDGDWLFIGTLSSDGEAMEALKEISTQTAFKTLGAIKSKHYLTVDGSKWTSIGGPLAALSIIEESTKAMTGTGLHH